MTKLDQAQCPVCGNTEFFTTVQVQLRVSLLTWGQSGSGDFLATALEPDQAAQKALKAQDPTQVHCQCQECGNTVSLSGLLGEPPESQEFKPHEIKDFEYLKSIGESFDPHHK